MERRSKDERSFFHNEVRTKVALTMSTGCFYSLMLIKLCATVCFTWRKKVRGEGRGW